VSHKNKIKYLFKITSLRYILAYSFIPKYQIYKKIIYYLKEKSNIVAIGL